MGSIFVKKQNGFYRLCKVQVQEEPSMVSFYEITGVASDLGFNLLLIGDSVDLVVSKDRLFCVVRRGARIAMSAQLRFSKSSLQAKSA